MITKEKGVVVFVISKIINIVNNTILGKGYIRNKVDNTKGRFPANFIHDGSDEVTDLFPYTKTGKPMTWKKR